MKSRATTWLVLVLSGCGGAGGGQQPSQGPQSWTTTSKPSSTPIEEAQSDASPTGRSDAGSSGLPPRHAMNDDARDEYKRGLVAAEAFDLNEADARFSAALRADPKAYLAAYNLGVIAARRGDEDRALESYKRALQIQPDHELSAAGVVAIYTRRDRLADALSFVQPLADRWTNNLALQVVYGHALVQASQEEEAIKIARRALRKDERYTPAMMVLVKANQRLGRTELAQSVLEQALKVNDRNPEAHYLLGVMYRDQGRLMEAIAEWRKAVELQPEYVDARTALGVQLLAGGNYPEALDHLKVSARLAPSLVAVHLNLADAYRANQQWLDAKKEFDIALRMDPKLAEAHYNLGLLYMSAGEAFPGLDRLGAMQASVQEFTTYRELMGPRLTRDDPSQSYLEDLVRGIEREKKRLAREKAKAEKANTPAGETKPSAVEGQSSKKENAP
jgi:tetratricopeptide (TPR) repeat protein